MGQYYYAAIIRRKAYTKKTAWHMNYSSQDSEPGRLEMYYPFHYDNSLKLMEHSYWGNTYAMTVESQLIRKKGRWIPPNFAVIGDYAEVEHYVKRTDDNGTEYPEFIPSDVPKDHEDFGVCEAAIMMRKNHFSDQLFVRNAKNVLDPDKTYYALNWTQKEYVQMNGCPEHDEEWPIRIDPLFILCSVGNGRGGGDYYHHADNEELAGKWAFDRIEITDQEPTSEEWSKLEPMFLEHWN